MNEIYHEIKCIFLYDIFFYLKRYTEIHKYSVDVFFINRCINIYNFALKKNLINLILKGYVSIFSKYVDCHYYNL